MAQLYVYHLLPDMNAAPPTIGILAGMGPHSTAPFLELVLAECQRRYGAKEDIDFPPIMLRSHPTPFYQRRFAEGGLAVVDIDWQDDIDALLVAVRSNATPAQFAEHWSRITRRAEAAEVDTLIIACLDLSATVAHIATAVPVLDASQCLAEAIVTEWLRRRSL